VPRWRDLEGYYTRFGDVRELVAKTEDRYVIMNAGDELRLSFEAPPPPPAGWTRDFVLIGDGWVKDGDYNTSFSKTVLPLPGGRPVKRGLRCRSSKRIRLSALSRTGRGSTPHVSRARFSRIDVRGIGNLHATSARQRALGLVDRHDRRLARRGRGLNRSPWALRPGCHC
jgi:hypothetical protein